MTYWIRAKVTKRVFGIPTPFISTENFRICSIFGEWGAKRKLKERLEKLYNTCESIDIEYIEIFNE